VKIQLLSFMLLALMAFINIPRDFYHSCEVDVHQSSSLVIDESHEECLICDFTFSVFGNDSQAISSGTIAEYGEYQPFAIALYASDSFSFCEGRAPPVLV